MLISEGIEAVRGQKHTLAINSTSCSSFSATTNVKPFAGLDFLYAPDKYTTLYNLDYSKLSAEKWLA